MERRNLALLCAGVLCFWLFALAVGTAQGAGLRVAIGGTGPAVQADAPAVLTAAPANSGLQLECRAAILMEPETGRVLYEKAPDERMPIASITKLMTLLLTFEAIRGGKLTLDTPVPVSEHAYHMGGSQIWLEPGEQFTLDEMLRAICVSSANDAAVAVAELVGGSEPVFVEQMNARAAELGMTNTTFQGDPSTTAIRVRPSRVALALMQTPAPLVVPVLSPVMPLYRRRSLLVFTSWVWPFRRLSVQMPA